MVARIIMKGIFATGIQIFVFVLILGIGSLFSIFNFYSLIFFITILVLQNIIAVLINNKTLTIVLYILANLICVFAFGEDIKSWPYQSILAITASFFALTSKIIIDDKIDKLIKI